MQDSGLADEEVAASREKYGSNQIPDSKPTTFRQEFRATFQDPMIRILLAVAALMILMCFLGYAEIYEPVGTIVAVLIVAFVSARTGVTSDRQYRDLRQYSGKDVSKVLRNGKISVIEADDVVRGDKVLLQAGDKVPADGVLVQGQLTVDNSVLNGEADECSKTAAPAGTGLPETITGDTFVDAHSLFRGEVVFDGEGYLEVREVGLSTMLGKMAGEMQDTEPDSPLKVKLEKLAHQISVFGYAGAIGIALLYFVWFLIQAGGPAAYFALGFAQVFSDLVKAVSLAVVIMVCAVPEGLPLMISLVLMQNTGKMLAHNVLVRRAVGIETAGSLNILFTDKTGTITTGRLEVAEFFTADGVSFLPGELSRHSRVKSMLDPAIRKNTQALFDAKHQVVGGNATDRALLRFIGEEKGEKFRTDPGVTGTDAQTFNSTNKFSQVWVESLGKTFYKGAPERLLEKAARCLDADGTLRPLDRAVVDAKIGELAGKAMRILAFAYSEKSMIKDEIRDDLVIIGLAGIRDDVRSEARESIEEVKRAGIQVVMITGDRPETAAAIAREAGLMQGQEDVALSSAQLAQMTDEEVKALLPHIQVIARALPTDKSRMVRLCQEMNLVVGMTGDGVNDSPALRSADVGFAMGSGTEAAKEASDIVILDDNFKSIKDAVWYGRTIYHNILKFCKFQLTINVAAVVVSAIAPFFGVEEPLRVTHLLFINLLMDSLGAIMFGNEPAQKKYMREKPRRRDESLVDRERMGQILFMAVWLTAVSFVYLKLPFFVNLFESPQQHRTGYFVLFVTAALCNGFNVRDDGPGVFRGLKRNKGFLQVFAAVIAVQQLIVNAARIPFAAFCWIGNMFSCVPFGWKGYAAVALLSLTVIPADLIRKGVTRKKRRI